MNRSQIISDNPPKGRLTMASAMDQTARDIETVYMAADAVLAAYKAVNRIPFDKRPALDRLLDGKVYPSDLDGLAKQLKALADEWQAELDAEEAA